MTDVPEKPSLDDPGSGKALRLEKYFRAMKNTDASDLHLKPGMQPYVRVKTQITSVRGQKLSAEEIEAIPVLGSGVAGAPAEDVSRYLEQAVVPTGEAPLAEEPPATMAAPSEPEAARRE